MALINKSDLQLDYDWSSQPGTSPIQKDDVGSKVFDRQKGDDVLTLINNYAEKNKLTDKNEVLRAEPMIRQKLPKDIKTEDDAMNWLWKALGNEEKSRI